jgi:hypothetical protein
MGLSLEVGSLAYLGANDPEGAEWFRESLDALNAYLHSVGMEPHHEPTACEVWSADMHGYSGLHYLRRLAAHVGLTGTIPAPGGEDSSNDPLLARYFAEVIGIRPRLLSWLPGRRRPIARSYDHLIVHSDAEGFYLPADFREVLIPPDRYPIPGGMVGSAPRLLGEVSRLARLLEIPETLSSESEDLLEAAASQGEGGALWQRYGIESHSCVVLKEGCESCLASGAALVFS